MPQGFPLARGGTSSSRLSTPDGLEGVHQAKATYRSIPEPWAHHYVFWGLRGPAAAFQFRASMLKFPVVPRKVTVPGPNGQKMV